MTTTATPPTTSNRPSASQPTSRTRPAQTVLPAYRLTTRKPTGTCSYPVIGVDGGEYAGKSTLAVELAKDPRIGQTWMLSLGEDIDWLGAIADFDVVNHNGQWWQIISAVRQIYAETIRIKAAAKPGDPTPLVILDSGTKVHELLSTWAENRARTSQDNTRRLLRDPNAEVNLGPTYWNPANRRHRQLMALFHAMPAIVVITARGKWVSAFDAKGQPVKDTKEWSVQANNELPFSTTAWVRLAQGKHPQIIGARMATGGIRPGYDGPLVVDPAQERTAGVTFNLAWVVFDLLGFNADVAQEGRIIEPVADADPDEAVPAPVRSVPADADEAPGADDGDVVAPAVK